MNRRGAESAESAEGRRVELDRISEIAVTSAIEVHRVLGPGLLESIYDEALVAELVSRGASVRRQIRVPVAYKGVELTSYLVLDLLVDNLVIVEVKAVRQLDPVHDAQLLSYLRLTGFQVGLIFNFNVTTLRQGIRRLVNQY